MSDESSRKVVIPGEIIESGNDYLPGEGTEKQGENIVAMKFGLAEESNNLVKVIPLSGVYLPRRGNVVIGRVENITFNGWVVDVGTAEGAFIPLTEVPRFVNKNELDEVMDIGDMVVAKIMGVNQRGIDLTVKIRGLGRGDEGLIFKRVIGKEGSMIKLIKDETGCNITVGQNGFIWIQGDKIENELKAKEAVMFITERSFIKGLTEELKKWFDNEPLGKVPKTKLNL